jgi:pimeloyl-ACP methyl ester carboxylesterase
MKSIPAHQTTLLREFRAAHPYRQLQFEDWSWRYISAGNGARALLLLPGAFVGAEMWIHLIMYLQDRYRILAPDMPSKSLTLAEMNAAFVKLLDGENISKAIVVGYSAGGGLAQAFVQAHPERVETLILSHCTPLSSGTAHRLDRMAGLMRLMPLSFIRAVFKKRLNRYPVISEWADFTRAFFAERIASLNKADLMQFFESGLETAREFKFEPQNWRGQTLLLSSKDDTTTFKRLNEMQARYPSAQIHVFEQGGHHTLLLFPEIYNSTLKKFLDG